MENAEEKAAQPLQDSTHGAVRESPPKQSIKILANYGSPSAFLEPSSTPSSPPPEEKTRITSSGHYTGLSISKYETQTEPQPEPQQQGNYGSTSHFRQDSKSKLMKESSNLQEEAKPGEYASLTSFTKYQSN